MVPAKGGTSGKVFPMFRVFGQSDRRGKVPCSACYGHVTDERTAYSDSLDFSEQLSYRKHFHPSYGLKDMNFQSLFEFLEYLNNRKRI